MTGPEEESPLPASETAEEELEGIPPKGEDAGWGDYPIDTVLIRNETRTVFEVVRRIKAGGYVMDPDFQRDFIWAPDKQSKLIESVLMRIPLPVFYLAEDDQGRTIVVDGLQRLSTFQRFLGNELRLKLPGQHELDKKRFRDLSAKLQNRVEDSSLVLYIVDAKVPERARLDIFERVNGGVPLTRQQMRNCLYNGAATRFLESEAKLPLFTAATGDSLNTKTMRDREFVNRYCAFRLLPVEEYKGDMDAWLAAALTKMNSLKQSDLTVLSDEFHTSLQNNFKLFGTQAFRKHERGQNRRGILNASLWDVMSTGFAQVPPEAVEAKEDEVKARFYSLITETRFIDSITYGPNSPDRVRHRFEAMKRLLAEVFHADAP
jgi:hypothetical protein